MENEVTRRARCNFHKLIAYGFEKQVGQYIYHTIMMDVFNVEIHVDEEGNLSGNYMIWKVEKNMSIIGSNNNGRICVKNERSIF